MDFRFIRDTPHYIFDNEKEFVEHFIHNGLNKEDIPVIKTDWKTAELDDWVWSDDERIVQVLKVGHMKNTVRSPNKDFHSTKYIRTIVGSFIVSKKSEMDTDFSGHADRYKFSRVKRNNKDSIISRTATTVREKCFVTYFTYYNPNPVEAYMTVFETKNEKFAERRAYFLLMQPRIKMAIRAEIETAASQLKLSDVWVLEKLKKVAEVEDQKPNIIIQAATEIGKIIGTYKEDDGSGLPRNPKLLPDGTKHLDAVPDLKKAMEEAEDAFNETNSDELNA